MFSYKNIFLAILAGMLITSCDKKTVDLVAIDSFTVNADSTRSAEPTNDTAYYALGSKTTFNFTGNPAGISFFSGEIGKRYIYHDRVSADGIPRLIFTHALNSGSQDNTLQVMLSFDFKGVVTGDSATTASNIAAASWSNITPEKVTNKIASAIDTVDLSSYAPTGKKAFIAFKYVASAGTVQNKWTITNLSVTNSLPDNTTYTNANLNAATTSFINYGVVTFSPGWVGQNVANTYKWVITAGTSLVITGAATAADAVSNSEAWVVLGAIDLKKVTPDVGVPVKDMTVKPSPFQYVYGAKGKYDAIFVAHNTTVYTEGAAVKKIPVVIQ